jgi:hypothetical protein
MDSVLNTNTSEQFAEVHKPDAQARMLNWDMIILLLILTCYQFDCCRLHSTTTYLLAHKQHLHYQRSSMKTRWPIGNSSMRHLCIRYKADQQYEGAVAEHIWKGVFE